MKKFTVFLVALLLAVLSTEAQQGGLLGGKKSANRPAETPAADAPHSVVSIEFNAAPLDLVFIAYGKLINKTILKDPALPNGTTITLKPKDGQELTDEEKVFAVETVLEMNGIHIEPYGDTDKFVRAIPRNKIRTEGIPLILDPKKLDVKESTHMVSYMVYLKNITIEEAQKIFEGLKSKDAQLSVFERTNSILVTDTGMNIKRMLEVIDRVDVATPVTEQVFNRQIKYASCNEIKTVLEAIVQDSKQEQEKANGGKQVNNRNPTPAPMRASDLLRGRNGNNNNAAAGNETQINSMSDADRGTIRGKVLIISDERSNKLIIVTSQANMDFFDKVIEQLDIETTPDTVVKVYRLKYAEADKVSDMINDLIGNAPSSKSGSKNNQNQNARNGQGGNMSRGTAQVAKKPANQRTGEAKAGELSKENTTVLADERINGIVVMTSKELVPVVESIIESMDVKLSQVLIETCILEVGLNHDVRTGMDWVNGIRKKGNSYEQALGGGGGDAKAIAGAATNALFDAAKTYLPSIFTPGQAGLSYAVFSKSMNLGAIISLSQSDGTSKYIASPVVMTVDNKEATIEATQSRKFYSGSTSTGSYGNNSVSYNYSDKEIGIKIKVTPKINPNGTVMLEVEEEYSQVGPKQEMLVSSGSGSGAPSKEQVDTALTRKMSADVLLDNRQTVVLGGLTDTHLETSDSGIPLLKDIPWVGKYLFGSTSTSESRSELLVFLTPYVLADGAEAEAEALRRKQALSDPNAWDDHGWSQSKLADPVKAKELLRRQKLQWKNLDEEHQSQFELDKAKQSRVLDLKERAIKDEKARKAFEEQLKEREKEIEAEKSWGN